MERLPRLVTHAVVLLIAVGLASYTSVNRGVTAGLLRTGIAGVIARSSDHGGLVDQVMLGRSGTVVNQVAIPTQVPVRHTPIPYTVVDREDLRSIAAQFNVTLDEIRWSNPWLGTTTRVQTGDFLLIPPIAGVVVTVRRGDTVESLGSVWHVQPPSIIDFNYLRDPIADLRDGRLLVLPAGYGTQISPQPPGPGLPAATGSRGTFAIKVGGSPGPYAVTRFPFGQCTWYVATRVPVPWNGNAWQWYGAAQASGWAVGTTPRAGAIMVTWENRTFGHVAFVDAVNLDGSWTVSEMNYVGWGVINQRTIHAGQVPLIGFVYPPI